MTLLILLAAACSRQEAPPSDAERLMGEALTAIGSHDLRVAEQNAFNAAILAADSTETADALTLLSLVYTLEGKEHKARMVLDVLPRGQSLELVRLQDQANRQAKRSERHLYSALATLLILLAAGSLWRSRRREAVFMRRVDELMAARPATGDRPSLRADIARTKEGVDVLYAIQHDDNISQMGKRQQQAVSATLQLVEPRLAKVIGGVELTPKETFYCIMHYYGKTDRQKARCFCCTEQALRSTKSRLGKKLDLNLLKDANDKPTITDQKL